MFYSLSRLIRQVRRRKELGISLLLVLIVVAIGGNTLSFYLFESDANPDITVWDSIWYRRHIRHDYRLRRLLGGVARSQDRYSHLHRADRPGHIYHRIGDGRRLGGRHPAQGAKGHGQG